MNKIPIVLAFDNNYVKPAAALIASILKNTKTDVEFNILHTGLSSETQAVLKKLSEIKDCSFNFIDMDKYVKTDLSKYMAVRDDYNYISTATYYRFFLTDIFKEPKVLYLDIDMIVQRDLWPLFNTDISKCYAGVVQDSYMKVQLEQISPFNITFGEYFKKKLKKKKQSYFNAGMILFNLDLMRKEGITEKLWDFTVKESPLLLQDQDVLNAVLESKLKYLDPKYNVFPQFPAMEVSIIHYVGPIKPHNRETDIKFWEKYWEYFKLTPFFTEEDKSFLDMINSLKPHIKMFELFNKRILKVKQYPDRLKIRLFNKTFIFDAQKKIDKLARKYKGKSIVLYGAGKLADTIFNRYDLSGLNIVGISDIKFKDKGEFHGLNCIPPHGLRDIEYDVILVSALKFNKYLDYLEDSVLEGSKNEDKEIKALINGL